MKPILLLILFSTYCKCCCAQNILDKLDNKNCQVDYIGNYKPVKLSCVFKGDSVQYIRKCFIHNGGNFPVIVTVKLPYGYYKNCLSGAENFVLEGYSIKLVELAANK